MVWKMSLVALVAALGMTSGVRGDVLNFDSYPVVGGTSFAAVDYYKPSGVLFNKQIPIEAVAIAEPTTVAQFVDAGGTLPNALALQIANGTDIELTFVVPGTSTPAVISAFSALFWDTEVGSTLGTIQAYDAANNLLQTATATTPASEGQVLSVSSPGIARLRLSVDADGADLDNFVFSTPTAVPEPASLLVVGLGSAGLLCGRRRGVWHVR